MENPLIDISTLRVRIPSDLYPYRGSHVLEIISVDTLNDHADGWCQIADASDLNVVWDSGFKGKFFRGNFEERNYLNFPGPFYGAETDSCVMGPMQAPSNVMLNSDSQEFIFRQPSTLEQVRQVISAALCDPYSGYGADGNDHWTLRLVREWWSLRSDVLAEVASLSEQPESVAAFTAYLEGPAERALQEYAFFLDKRRLPTSADRLPEL